MKKIKALPLILLAALLLFAVFIGVADTKTASAESSSAYKFSLAAYSVTYDISENCSIKVTEDISVSYEGYASTGFIRDIPVNGGAQVRNVNVKKISNGNLTSVYYKVGIEDGNYISVDIGDSSNKRGVTETYRLTYTYNITNSVVKNGVLPLNPIGTGWECAISNATVTLILPDGYENAKCYVGKKGSTTELAFDDTQTSESGRVILTASCSSLAAYNGVSFDITFKKGSITNYFDFTPYIFVIAGLIVLFIIVILKLLVFNKSILTPIVNYEAPDKMDPLIMGKLIDNKVNSEDVTSLIYYWANKGYLKINLDDKDNPILIRLVTHLPAMSASYEQTMFNALFSHVDAVAVNSLKGSFYQTVEKVTAQVNAQAKGLYESKTIGISIIFAIIGALLIGLTPLILAFLQISSTMLYYVGLIAVIPALLIYAATETVMYYRLKISKGKFIGSMVALIALCAVVTLLYAVLLPSSIMGVIPKVLLCLIGCAIVMTSVLLINRTKAYTEKLNDIVGFRNFIMLAEKDQLEAMLEDDPQFYYHILPYAQVLGVTSKWEEKFDSLTVQPPAWLAGNMATTIIELHVLNSIIRNSTARMSAGMISRPASSGTNGGGGGRFGGFSGGGFGGGGGRGR